MKKSFLPAIALILALCGQAAAQGGACALFGNLIIPARDHDENFEVLLLSSGGEQVIARTNIDIENHFFFQGIPEGRYDVVVRLDGFKELREPVRVPAFGSTACVDHEILWLTPTDTVVLIDERLRGYPKEAIDEYVFAIEADSDKKYAEVVRHLETVVKLAADWFDAHCELGAAYEEVHRSRDAEAEYRAALVLKPDGFRAQMSLGRLFLSEADERIQRSSAADAAQPILDQAREALSAAATEDPKSAMASYLLGAVDFRLASFNDAEMELKSALELDPTTYPARIMLINVYVKQQRWDNALDEADAFIIENPASPYRQQVMATRSSVVRRLQPAP